MISQLVVNAVIIWPNHIYTKICQFLTKEYDIIPPKERIGKGRVFIAKCVVEGSFPILLAQEVDLFDFSVDVFDYAEKIEDLHLKNFALVLLAKTATISETMHNKVLEKVKEGSYLQ